MTVVGDDWDKVSDQVNEDESTHESDSADRKKILGGKARTAAAKQDTNSSVTAKTASTEDKGNTEQNVGRLYSVGEMFQSLSVNTNLFICFFFAE